METIRRSETLFLDLSFPLGCDKSKISQNCSNPRGFVNGEQPGDKGNRQKAAFGVDS